MFIGVDIGGSNMAAGLFDENRKLITRAKVKSKAKEETEVIIGQLFKVYSGEFFRTAFSQKIDVKLSKTLSILTLPKYTSEGVL